jgi:hypothetical protein
MKLTPGFLPMVNKGFALAKVFFDFAKYPDC